jgi:antitoxin (DNA-binding transcriptional repressor) of toxin-antitoxin stability system
MATIYISEAEAYRDFPSLLARVRAGAEVVIEDASSPPVVLRPAAEPSLRRLSESLRLASAHGSTVTLDGAFSRDLEVIVNSHQEPLEDPWA